MSRSRSDVEYKKIAESITAESGTHDLTVTNVSPYVSWSTKRLEPSLEAGLRHDRDDGNTDSGVVNLNAGVSRSSPTDPRRHPGRGSVYVARTGQL